MEAKGAKAALDALQVLLNGVMMRHSKTQTWLDGTTILSLPPRRLGAVLYKLI